MRYFLIMNPGSHTGRSQRRFEQLFALLKEAGIDYDFKLTTKLSDAYAFSVAANIDPQYQVIVAVGGDGTINGVLNGFYDTNGHRRSSAKMGVIYTGTSPDFCKSYGIPLDLTKAVQTIALAATRSIQVGQIVLAERWLPEYEQQPVAESSEFVTRYFACCANFGLGATLARRANSGIRGVFGDRLGTFLALMKTLFNYRSTEFLVKLDGVAREVSQVYNISVGRTYYIASGIKVKHDLIANDNRFYQLVVRELRLTNFLQIISQLYRGKEIINQPELTLEYFKTFEIYGNSTQPEVEFDGDPAGFLPCRIQSAAETLELICEGVKYESRG